MKRTPECDEERAAKRATGPGSAGRGTGKALKDVLRAHRPDPDFAYEVRELREFIGPAQTR